MIQNLTCRVLFLKILFQAYKLFIQIPVDFIRFFFNVRFSNRKSQSHQKLLKKITHFTIQFRSKNFLTHFTNLSSLDIVNNMLPQYN